MPHLVVEYFAPEGLDGPAVLSDLLDTAVATGIMQRADVKARLLPSEVILLGDGRSSFIHVTVSMLAGRTPEAKLGLSVALTGKLREVCPDIEAISADIRDMDPDCYKKSLKA